MATVLSICIICDNFLAGPQPPARQPPHEEEEEEEDKLEELPQPTAADTRQ